jgi:PAB-dependent poly(A)-specific ribonuclease subunit 3
MICERGEFAGDPSWSEHGDRYPLKLFRDHTFHQVDRNGKPSLALGHVVSSLNRLDAAVDERIVLTSRDDQSVFVVTYKELKQMFDRAFNELVKHNSQGSQGL